MITSDTNDEVACYHCRRNPKSNTFTWKAYFNKSITFKFKCNLRNTLKGGISLCGGGGVDT